MNIEIHVAPTSAKTWIAATASSPYFCFEADSRDAVIAIVKRALRFYAQNLEAIIRVRSERERPDITPIQNEAHRELVAV
jgi:hypothetical protein